MSACIGLPFDSCRRIGNPVSKTGRVSSINSWRIESKSFTQEDPALIEQQIQRSLDGVLLRIRDHTDRFRDLVAGQDGSLLVGITGASVPPLIFPAETVRAIGALGVELEIDLVCGGDETAVTEQGTDGSSG